MKGKLPYQNPELAFEVRAKDLVDRMTLEEKISQMVNTAQEIKRLGIDAYDWWNEALHGVARAGIATMFPQAIGLAATFDDTLIGEIADVISTEGRAKHYNSIQHNDRSRYTGLTFWSPNINIFRDPRWGRGHETYGEDPFLTAQLGKAFVRGIQGDHPKYLKAAACAKHFAVHSGPENLRHQFNAVVSRQDLYETYLYAFKECVCHAKVESVMGAYNALNGKPCNGNEELLTEILRKNWGFQGHVVSDCGAIRDFHEHYHITDTPAQSAALAVKSGCDLNCGNMFLHLHTAVKSGLIAEEELDKAVCRLMVTRLKLGLVEGCEVSPYFVCDVSVVDSAEHNALSESAARKSLVLLKNEDHFLPVASQKLKTVAVIGPNADSIEALRANYYGEASEYITVLEGMNQALGDNVKVLHSPGCHLFSKTQGNEIAYAAELAAKSDLVVLCVGLDATVEGEEGDEDTEYSMADKPSLSLPGLQHQLIQEVFTANPNTVLVNLSGSAVSLCYEQAYLPAILQGWYPGSKGGRAIADAIFGRFSPAGRLPVTFYASDSQLPDFCDYSMKNRTYRYFNGSPLYPFGYGLSYSDFTYTDFFKEKDHFPCGESVEVGATVTNTGSFDSDEVSELYIAKQNPEDSEPTLSLKGFRRAFLKAKQSTTIRFELSPRDFALIDKDGACVVSPGVYKIFIGGGQPDDVTRQLTRKKVEFLKIELTGQKMIIDS